MHKYIGKICPFCKTRINEDDSVVVCSVCELPHHLSCWHENNGCTTFGCTGVMGDIIESSKSDSTNGVGIQDSLDNLQINRIVPQKRFELLYQNEPYVIQEGIPILIENESLIIDHNNNDQLMARFLFRSLTNQSISAIMIDVLCNDIWGKETQAVNDFQILDIKTKRNSIFGQTTPVPIPDQSTRAIRVIIKKVMLEDRSILTPGTEVSILPKQSTLVEYFGSIELAKEYIRESNKQARYVVVQGKDYWRCACGAINENNNSVCYLCNTELSKLQSMLDAELMAQNLHDYNEEQERIAAQIQAEREEHMRQEEERLKIAEESRKRQILEAKKRRKKRVKRIIFSTTGVILVTALVYLTGWHIIPYIRYSNACNALKAQSYDEAYAAFIDLGSFNNSSDMAVQTLYEKGLHLMDTGNYSEAASEFERIPDYLDSSSKAVECRNEVSYLQAIGMFENGEYQDAYDVFNGISTYKDSSQKEEECVFCIANEYLKAKNYKDAYETFKKVKGSYIDGLQEKINESGYAYAKELFNSKKYQEAISIYQNISGYKDTADKLMETRYQYALECKSNSQWEKASDLFNLTKGYKNSDSLFKETYYNYGIELIKSRKYVKAIDVLGSDYLKGYKESKAKINEAKYGYVTNNKNNSDYTTYNYLKELIAVGYKDSQSIYNDLYKWKITNVYFNTSESSALKYSAIDKYSPVYCHFTLSGGPPGGKTKVYYYITFPNGQQENDSSSYKSWDGDELWVGWKDGIYSNPLYGQVGKLSFSFYDEDSNYIGSGSVYISYTSSY